MRFAVYGLLFLDRVVSASDAMYPVGGQSPRPKPAGLEAWRRVFAPRRTAGCRIRRGS